MIWINASSPKEGRHKWDRPAVPAGRPFVNSEQAGGATNQIVYWSGLPSWKNQTLTPNPDLIYLMPFLRVARSN